MVRWTPSFIKAWRRARHLTQEQLGARLTPARDASIISRLERGQIPYSQEWLEVVAEALDCGPADLLRPPISSDAIDPYDLVRQVTETKRGDAIRILKALSSTDA